jgi:glycosyltransferase involved in cell wall biosynthesis
MRILFVLGGLRVGGYEILSVRIAEALAKRGKEIAVLSLGHDESIVNRIPSGIPIYTAKRFFKLDVSVFIRIAIMLRRFRPDIIVSCAFFEYFLTKIASPMSLRKHKYLLVFHQTKPYDAKEDHWNRVYSSLSRLFNDHYVGIHSSQIEFYRRNYGLSTANFTLIYNGVDTNYYSPDAKRSKRGSGIFHIVHVANLKPLKDQWTLLKAMVELNTMYEAWDLTIVGADQSDLQRAYQDYVVQQGIVKKVRFLGAVPDTRILLRDSDVFVLTSLTEALPLSLIEAIAMGLPCIVTDVGGNSDIIESGKEGFLVRPGDYVAIARYLKHIIDHPIQRKRMCLAARAKAVAHFNIEMMIDKYVNLLGNILEA